MYNEISFVDQIRRKSSTDFGFLVSVSLPFCQALYIPTGTGYCMYPVSTNL